MFFVVAFLLCLVILLLDLWYTRSSKDLPPRYPGCLPLIGQAHLLLGDGKSLWNRIQDVQRHCIERGGVTHLKLGPQIHYIICDPDDYFKVMETCLEKNYWYRKMLSSWVGEGLVTASVPVWKRHRKLLSPSFGQRVINTYTEALNRQARGLADHMSSFLAKGPFDALECIAESALELNFQTTFGLELDKGTAKEMKIYNKAFAEIQHVLTERIQNLFMHSDFIYSFTELKKRQDKALMITRSLSDEIIKRKRAALKNSYPNTNLKEKRFQGFMDLLLELSDDDVLTDEEIHWEVDTMALAGYDTSSTTACYVCVLLGSYPDVQEKVYQELLEVFGESNRDVEQQDISKLVYLDAVIKEVGRLYPSAPVITRYADKEVELKNYTMPAGSNCAILISGLNRHTVWGPDRDEFRPERWLDPTTLPPNANAFTGFSTGRRACLGKPYAVLYMKITLAHLLRRYKITADYSKMVMQMAILLKPDAGCYISLEPRSASFKSL